MAVWELVSDSDLRLLYSSLPAVLFQEERWFADRKLQNEIELFDSIQFHQVGSTGPDITFNLYQTEPFTGYYYNIPLLITQSKNSAREVLFEKNGHYFYDAIPTYEYVSLLEELIQNRASFSASQGIFQFQPYHNLNEPHFHLHGSTSNSLLFVTRRYLLKNYRRIYPGVNPELKISGALTKIGSNQTPEVYGFFNYQAQTEYTLGIIMEALDNSGTGWERWGRILKSLSFETEELLAKEAGLLGSALGHLHRDMATIAREAGGYSKLNLSDLEKRIDQLIIDIKEGLTGFPEFDLILSKLHNLKKRFNGRNLGAKFRIHGDLHLEQVIKTADGWRILDFEGEPLKSIPERENYDSPLKDLASMLRSISYRLNVGNVSRREIEMKISSSLSEGYLQSCREIRADFLPGPEEFDSLLTFFQIERAVYECVYESKYRPDWLRIPRTGLAGLIRSI